MLFPEAGGKQVDLKGRVGVDPLQHINQVRIGINALQTTRGDQALDHADVGDGECVIRGARERLRELVETFPG